MIQTSRIKIYKAYEDQIARIVKEFIPIYDSITAKGYISKSTALNIDDSISIIISQKYKIDKTGSIIADISKNEAVVNASQSLFDKYNKQAKFRMDLIQMLWAGGDMLAYNNRTNQTVKLAENDKVLFYVFLPPNAENSYNILPATIRLGDNLTDSQKAMTYLFHISTNATKTNSFDDNLPGGRWTEKKDRIIVDKNYYYSLEGRKVFYTSIVEGKSDGGILLYKSLPTEGDALDKYKGGSKNSFLKNYLKSGAVKFPASIDSILAPVNLIEKNAKKYCSDSV